MLVILSSISYTLLCDFQLLLQSSMISGREIEDLLVLNKMLMLLDGIS